MSCEFCEDTHPAVVVCQDCKQKLCASISQVLHAPKSSLKNHRIIPILGVSASPPTPIPTQQCARHQKKLSQYCQTDMTTICSRCIDEHVGNSVVSIEKAFNDRKGQFTTVLTTAQTTITQLKQTEDDIKTRANAVRAQHGELHSRISTTFEKLIEVLTTRREVLLTQLESTTSTKQKKLEDQRKEIQQKREILETCRIDLEQSQKGQDIVKALTCEKTINAEFEKVVKGVMRPTVEANTTFDADTQQLQKTLETVGTLRETKAPEDLKQLPAMLVLDGKFLRKSTISLSSPYDIFVYGQDSDMIIAILEYTAHRVQICRYNDLSVIRTIGTGSAGIVYNNSIIHVE